jgi:hypothetical protein
MAPRPTSPKDSEVLPADLHDTENPEKAKLAMKYWGDELP